MPTMSAEWLLEFTKRLENGWNWASLLFFVEQFFEIFDKKKPTPSLRV